MSDSTGQATLPALARAHAALDDLLAADLTALDEDPLVEGLREHERLRNRLAAVDHKLIAEIEARRLADQHNCRTVVAFLGALLRINRGEAASRVRAAAAAAPLRTLTGQPLAAPFEFVAAAQASGAISAGHARVITELVDDLPDHVQAEHGGTLEAELVRHARDLDPRALAICAQRLRDLYDADGELNDPPERARFLHFWPRVDGTARIEGELSAECAEHLQVHLDALARPTPTADGHDSRSAAQRRHDALLASLKLVERAELLPSVGGVSSTLIVTMTEESYRIGRGLAVSSHGAAVPARHALGWAGGDCRLLAVALNRAGAPIAHTGTHRLFSENQRLALLAAYGGCCFPDCDAPPAWTEIHHVTEWRRGGRTVLPNAAPVCGHHHRHFAERGWQIVMIHDRAAWIPPSSIDPERVPRSKAPPLDSPGTSSPEALTAGATTETLATAPICPRAPLTSATVESGLLP